MLNRSTFSAQRTALFYPVLLIGLIALFPLYKYVLQIFPSIITQQLMTDFHLSAAGLGNLAATFYYAYLFSQFFVGYCLDRYALRWVIVGALLSCAGGAFLFATAHTALAAGLARGLMGLGVAFAPIAYMKIAAVWCPKKHFAFVNGWMATASMLGAICGESVLNGLVQDYGWRESLFYVAIFGAILAAVFLFVLPTHSQQKQQPKITRQQLLAIITKKNNWLLCLYGGFAFSPLAIFGGLWGNPFLQAAYGINQAQAAHMITLIFVGLAVGSPIIGMISDRLNQRQSVIVIGTGLALINLVTVIYGQALGANVASYCLFLFGFFLGSYMLVFTIGKETNPLAFTATVVALLNASEAVLDSVTEPLIGKILDLSWQGAGEQFAHVFSVESYQFALGILPVYMGVALIAAAMVKNKG